jgi:peptide/nickel transport system ATP-binding protein
MTIKVDGSGIPATSAGSDGAPAPSVLEVRGLSVSFGSGAEAPPVVTDVDLTVGRGRIVGLVGESGSGKSVTARAVMGLLRPPGRVTGGSIHLGGVDLLALGERDKRALRGRRLAMVFQDPLSALNPSMRVGEQVVEALTAHGSSSSNARRRAAELFELVGIAGGADRLRDYPHELSGGMRQRVVIAAALANSPELIIADEPTSALDVTVQAQVLELLVRLRDELGVASLFITHDMGVVAELCDDVTVMRRGRVVEAGEADALFARPADDYTRALLAAVPRLDGPTSRPNDPAGRPASDAAHGLTVDRLRVDVSGDRTLLGRRRPIYAVDDVSLVLAPGETLGLVGESGCGKTTLSRAIAGLLRPTSGSIRASEVDITQLPIGHPSRRRVQYIFQDAYSALNPLRTIRQTLLEGLGAADATARRGNPEELMAQVGLDADMLDRFPAEFSGGQRQRIGIARALAADPSFLLCDEPVSSLDVSVQAQIVRLLSNLCDRYGLGQLFIAHDLAVVRQISDRLAVMFLGRIVETGPAEEVYGNPQHPYTVALLSATPVPDRGARRERIVLYGDPPSPRNPPRGCRFAARCPIGPAQREDRGVCLEHEPVLAGSATHQFACHFPGELALPSGRGHG